MSEVVTQAQPHTGSSAANKRVKFIIGGAVIALAIIYLIFTATQSTAAYFLTVEELNDKGSVIYDRNVRVSGKVIGDSIDFNSRDLNLSFEIVGEEGGTLPVVFNGPKPDQMRHDAEAIIEGKYDGNEFIAQTLLLKCPSRYEEGGFTEEKVEAVR
ncbi:MAG: cytochrome c maturation protein CcmE [Anaerolineales bacterium]|nr:MAG: cytochrome c maturation protein CcmE [Anaerolineales bacterium]